MALTQVSIFETDQTGADETILLQAKTATISNALYGVDSNNAPIAQTVTDDSVKFTVLNGVHALTIYLVSVDAGSEEVTIYQGADPVTGALTNTTVVGHSGIATLLIKGT
jgi:hypothetical protein